MFEPNGRHDDPALTMEEILKDNEEFQRKQTEKLHKDLPDIMAAFQCEDDSFHDDSEEEINIHKQNGGKYLKTNGNHAADDHNRERELLLDVRNRQVKKMEQNIDALTSKYLAEVKSLEENLNHALMEKQRAILSLKDSEEQIIKLRNVQRERDDFYQQVRNLNDEVRMLKLTINDQDRTIKMLTDASHDNQRMSQFQNDLEHLKQKHQGEISSLNHQLELSLQKCKSYERDNFELEKKIKYLEERNDDMMTQKAGTITKLMTQIQELEDKLFKKSNSDVCSELKQGLLAAKAVEQDLKAELSVREALEKRLRMDLEEVKAELECCKISEENSFRRKKSQSKGTLAQLVKGSTSVGVQTAAWSVDANNAQYLRFHEEQMASLRQECEALRLADVHEKDEIVENLRAEVEQVKKKYLSEYDDGMDVRKLQQELATSTERLLELRRIHSEHCIPELENRDLQINELQNQVKDMLDKISVAEKAESALKEKLANAYRDKEAEIARYEADAEEMRRKIGTFQRSPKSVSPATSKDKPQDRLFTRADMTKILEDIARTHFEEINKYEVQLNELETRLTSRASQENSGSNEPSAELTLELWRKLEVLQSQNNDLMKCLKNGNETETELRLTTEKLKEAQGKAARLKIKLLNIAEKYNRAREKFKTTRDQFCSRSADVRRTLETERIKWEKERERWHKEQEKWDLERQLFSKGKEIWEAERVKREKALRDLITHVESLKAPQPQETVNALAKLYDDLIISMQRLK